MMAASVQFSGLWLSYGAVVLNLLFWTHPTLNAKWWISLDFKPPTLYSINKYSFSSFPSSSIFSSIMAEVTAVKAFFVLYYSSLHDSVYPYKIMKLLKIGWEPFAWCGFSSSLSLCLFPEWNHFVIFFPSFSPSSTCVYHSIGFYCLIKIKTIPKCSRITQGLSSVQYVKAAKRDSQEDD